MATTTALKKKLNELDDYLLEMMNRHTLAGLAVGVVQDGKLVYTKGLGYADFSTGKPISMDTHFRIASISKTFTAIGIMQLWEQGKFNLDDPVNNYLKGLKVLHKDPFAPPITFRHMLTHTSGIGEAPSIKDILLTVAGKDRWFAPGEEAPINLSEFYGGLFISDVPAGQKWAYANHAFAMLGKLIEDISGTPFPEYMRANVFEPLGMDKTDYLFSERVRDTFAQGYQLKKGTFCPIPFRMRRLLGAGSVFSCVNDMAKYMAALMNGGANEHGRILKPETLEMMMTSQLATDPRVFSIGFAFHVEDFGGHLVTGHSGALPGFNSDMKIAPHERLGVVVFTNMASAVPDRISSEVMRRLLDIPNPDADFPPKTILSRPYDWERFIGFYGPKPGFLSNLRLWMSFVGEVEVFVDKQNRLAIRTLLGPLAKGMPIYRFDAEDPMLYRGIFKNGLMAGTAVPLLFHENHEGAVDRLSAMQYELFKRPKAQSLRFKVNAVSGVIAGLTGLLLLGKWLRRKK